MWGSAAAAAAAAAELAAGSAGAALCTACAPGWFGPDCSAQCSDQETCRERGFCDGQGRCVCFFPFAGLTCDTVQTDYSSPFSGTDLETVCDLAVDPAITALQPIGYQDGLRAADAAALIAHSSRFSSVEWLGESLTLTLGRALPAWTTINVVIPSFANISVPINGLSSVRASSSVTATVLSDSASITPGGPASLPVSSLPLKCEHVSLEVPGNRLCSGSAQVRVCAPNLTVAAVFAAEVVLPALMDTSEEMCDDLGGPCPSAAGWVGPSSPAACCGNGFGVGDFAFCATDYDCTFDPDIEGMKAVTPGVPMISTQCCAECERLATQTMCGKMTELEAAAVCLSGGCSQKAPCSGYAVTSATGPPAGRGAPASVLLATGSGLDIPPGVWPVAAPATVAAFTGDLADDSLPFNSSLVSDVLEFGPSGLNFSEPGVTLIFALSSSASSGPSPGQILRVFRLTNGAFHLHPFVPEVNLSATGSGPPLLRVKTMSFSVYAVFDVPAASLLPPEVKLANTSFATPQPANRTQVLISEQQSVSFTAKTVSWVAVGAGAGSAVLILVAVALLSRRLCSFEPAIVDGTSLKISSRKEALLEPSSTVSQEVPNEDNENQEDGLKHHDSNALPHQLPLQVYTAVTAGSAGAEYMEEYEPDMKDLRTVKANIEKDSLDLNGSQTKTAKVKPEMKIPDISAGTIPPENKETDVATVNAAPITQQTNASFAASPSMLESRTSLAAPTAAAAAAAAAMAAARGSTLFQENSRGTGGLIVSRMDSVEASADVIVLEHWRQSNMQAEAYDVAPANEGILSNFFIISIQQKLNSGHNLLSLMY